MAREIRKKVKVGTKGACVLYTDGTIRIDMVRFSYPHLRRPYKGDEGGEPKFGVVGLMPKKTHAEAHKLITLRINELLAENKVKAIPADKKFLRDGDESDKDGYEGNWMVSARETRRPPLRDENNQVVEPEEADEIFQPGFWGSILIRPWYQNNKYGKRVNAGLSSVQFIKKDEVFGEGRITDEDLDDTFGTFGDDGYDDFDEEEEEEKPKPRKKRPPVDDDDIDI